MYTELVNDTIEIHLECKESPKIEDVLVLIADELDIYYSFEDDGEIYNYGEPTMWGNDCAGFPFKLITNDKCYDYTTYDHAHLLSDGWFELKPSE